MRNFALFPYDHYNIAMIQKMRDQISEIKPLINKRFFYLLGSYLIFVSLFALSAKILSNIGFLIKIEVAFQQIILNLRVDYLDRFFIAFTDLGNTRLMIVWTLIAALIFFWKKLYIYSFGIVLSIGIAEFAAFILKNIIGRHRPPTFMALVSETSASFPSGHSIAAISFYGFLIFFFNRNISNKSVKNLLNCICVTMIVLAGLARVYLGAHWPSDVLASYILGIIWLFFVISVINNKTGSAGLENKAL